jgi:hypothetical protein
MKISRRKIRRAGQRERHSLFYVYTNKSKF